MTGHGEAARFAARLRALRERADYSYEALAQKTGISRSSLHRYCAGLSVPQDYGVVHRIATVCGATPTELRALHRLWALSDAERAQRVLPEDAEDAGNAGNAGNAAGEGDGGEASAAETLTASVAEDLETDETHRRSGTDGTPREPEPEPETDTHTHTDLHTDSDTDGPCPEATTDRRLPEGEPTLSPGPPTARGKGVRRGRLRTAVIAAITVVALGIVVWGVSTRSSQTKTAEANAERVLFSAACPPVLALGQQDECVKEAQRLLRQRGADIGVDGIFGPETRLRVTAFQVFAGLTPNGVVADPTKKALYESKARLDTWSPEKVRGRIHEVFAEAPADAVAIADCQSFLDPLYILPNTDGTRNWGLFQISDLRLQELGGTPSEALDPEWNIQAAKKLWSRDRDFHHWQCARALPQASPSQS